VNAAYDITDDKRIAVPFDWRNPDYGPIWQKRLERLGKLRGDAKYLQACRIYYRENLCQFIEDWGATVDPRNAGSKIPVIMPFVLFPRQQELIHWLVNKWRMQENGIIVKSRDCGASWLCMATSITLGLFWNDISVGFGSATEAKVDNSGDPDSLFYKGRMFLRYVPRDFKPGFDERKCQVDKKILLPWVGSSVTGDCGDRIGRGGRKTVFFVDEFADVEHPKLVDANLLANTDCRIELSTVRGTANVFAEHARGGEWDRFDFDYHDDPRKCNTSTTDVIEEYKGKTYIIPPRGLWPKFEEKKSKTDPIIWNQEYERDFLSSVEGVIIPAEWVEASIGAHEVLGITPSGVRRGAFDVADQGKDKCCYASGQGILVEFIKSWSGQGSKIYKSVEQAYAYADELGDDGFEYDGDGMGAGVSSDAERIDERRRESKQRELRIAMFRGSAAVVDPESKAPGTDRTNQDFFENFKAQAWWGLRCRFLATFKAVEAHRNGVPWAAEYPPDTLISISRDLPELTRTKSELSQPVWTWSKTGKMMIDKTPDDVASPNNGDSIMMRWGFYRAPLEFSEELLIAMERM
jgi:phage terminase large subunit